MVGEAKLRMQTGRGSAAASVGARLLGEIEETTLDEVRGADLAIAMCWFPEVGVVEMEMASSMLKDGQRRALVCCAVLVLIRFQVLASLRASFAATTNNDKNDGDAGNLPPASTAPKPFPISPLDALVNRHFRATQSAPLALTGRHRELLYLLIASLISPPHEKAVAVVDVEGRFDPLRLLATSLAEEAAGTGSTRAARVQRADLDHLHILRPARGNLAGISDCVASIEAHMLYGSHPSRGREWWGTVVIGGGLDPAGSASAAASAQVAVTADWKGWLRVSRAQVPSLCHLSAEEALSERDKRRAAVEGAGWVATSPWGGFTICKRERES